MLRGVFLGMKHAAPIMKRQRSGSIISTASVAGLQAGHAGHVYGAAKAAVIHLTTSVAMELGESSVRVNCVCPGYVVTPIIYRAAGVFEETQQSAERLADLMSTQQPMRRVCRPDEIAQAVLWLASDASSYVTGHALVVDGGLIGGRLWSAQQKARKLLNSALDLRAA
jgi:NAD(P)-dependent dehydrogenase (short-subunit alcohol dehydrogenase family)